MRFLLIDGPRFGPVRVQGRFFFIFYFLFAFFSLPGFLPAISIPESARPQLADLEAKFAQDMRKLCKKTHKNSFGKKMKEGTCRNVPKCGEIGRDRIAEWGGGAVVAFSGCGSVAVAKRRGEERDVGGYRPFTPPPPPTHTTIIAVGSNRDAWETTLREVEAIAAHHTANANDLNQTVAEPLKVCPTPLVEKGVWGVWGEGGKRSAWCAIYLSWPWSGRHGIA